MKLLILTQKMAEDDDVLGFFHNWAAKFAGQFEKIIVICLQKGNYSLPTNVEVLSLGKEAGVSRLKYIISFYKYIFQKRHDYDCVFVHMNPVYCVLGGFFWRLWNKKILLWYVHLVANRFLFLAEILADKILTVSPGTFPLKSKKIIAVGHGIDPEIFKREQNAEREENSFLYIGRIAPVKNLEILAAACQILFDKNIDFKLKIIGTGEPEYFEKIKDQFEDPVRAGIVEFVGSFSNWQIPSVCSRSETIINLTSQGSFDKVVLEAMACENLVLAANTEFKDVLPPPFIFDLNGEDLARKMENIILMPTEKKEKLGKEFREYVIKNHSLQNLIFKVKAIYEKMD